MLRFQQPFSGVYKDFDIPLHGLRVVFCRPGDWKHGWLWEETKVHNLTHLDTLTDPILYFLLRYELIFRTVYLEKTQWLLITIKLLGNYCVSWLGELKLTSLPQCGLIMKSPGTWDSELGKKGEKQFSCGFKSYDRVTGKPSIFRSHSLTTDVPIYWIVAYIESDNISFSVSRF